MQETWGPECQPAINETRGLKVDPRDQTNSEVNKLLPAESRFKQTETYRKIQYKFEICLQAPKEYLKIIKLSCS